MNPPIPHWSWDDLEAVLVLHAPPQKHHVLHLMLSRLKDDATRLGPRLFLRELMAVAAISYQLEKDSGLMEVSMH